MDKVAKRVIDRVISQRVASRYAMEHSSPQEMKEYLHDHPNADPHKHHVTKKEKPPVAKEPSPSKKGGALFSPHEVEKLPEVAEQKTKDPSKLLADAKVAHEQQLNWLNHGKGLDKAIGAKVIRGDTQDPKSFLKDLAEESRKPGPIIVIGPMKKRERIEEKVGSDYGGDWSRVGDIVRASVAVDSYDQLDDVMKKLKASGLKLARKPKDRFAKPTEAGYRDLMMNVEYPNGHVGELQIHLKPILQAKEDGHKFYEEVRSIEASAKKEGRTTMTDEEEKAVEEANRKMRDLYQQAWTKATGDSEDAHTKKAAMKTARAMKFFDWDGVPAYWTTKKFPMLVTSNGERPVYELQDFFTEATLISNEEFDKLKGENSKKTG